jgi:hypothetical protein
LTTNGRLCDFLRRFLKRGVATDKDEIIRAARGAFPNLVAICGTEFPHYVHAALETLGRLGEALHCRANGTPARKGERTGCWMLA